MIILPTELLRYFADSRLELESFTRDDNTLAIRVEKEIGPETGIITFTHVAFVSLPLSMPGEGIRARLVSEAEPEFWSLCKLAHDWFDPEDIVYEIESQDGPLYYVVAKSLQYSWI